MVGDVKNNIQLLEYPKVQEFNNLSNKEIIKFIENNKKFENKYKENLDYYIGKNTAIYNKRAVDSDNPDSRITVSYARTQTQIVKGYMYKPGLITYTSEDAQYLEELKDIFSTNDEELKTSELGENQSKYGIGIELLYTDIDEENNTIPMFESIKPNEIILFYDMTVKANLIGAIRYYLIKEENNKKLYNVEVYYKDKIIVYNMDDDNGKKTLKLNNEFPNYFNDIPFVVYLNNQEYHADYEPLKSLIDAYDILNSDALNEINRFASSYLVLKEYIFSNPNDPNEKTIELEKLKSRRVLEFLSGEGGAEFLTKDIPSAFFELIKQTLREDIEYHSHIPDFRGKLFEGKSGVALKWSLLDFENLCGDKQALFEKGLKRRIKLINNFLKIKAIDSAKVDIKFKRNVPNDLLESVNIVSQLKGLGLLSDKDLLRILPSDIVPDVEKALEDMQEQKDNETPSFNLDENINQEENMVQDTMNKGLQEEQLKKENMIQENQGVEE